MNLSLGNKIVARRTLLGLSQNDLAEMADVSVHTLSNVESGTGNPTLKTIEKILDILGLKLEIVVR